MRQLEARLASLPRSEIDKTKAYFDEMIQDRMEDGSTEEEAVAAMGDPAVVAAGILSDASIPSLVRAKVEKQREKSSHTGLFILIAILGFPLWFPLLMAIFSIVLAFYITIGAILISIYAVLFAFIVSGVACVVFAVPAFVMLGPARGLVVLGTGLILCGIALLLARPVVGLSRALVRSVAFILRQIKKALVGGKTEKIGG